MTTRAGRRQGAPRVWLAPLLALTALFVASALGVLSRSFVLDFISLWPFWAAVLVLAVVLRRRKIGRVRLGGFVPLVALLGIIALGVAHLQGWPGLPSSEVRLIGPLVDSTETAELSARVDGRLVIAAGSPFLYEVAPVRRGGSVTVPDAVERSSDGRISVVLGPSDAAGFYGFAGWDVTLASSPVWELSLEGDVVADFTGLDVSAATISGTGVLTLGSVDVETRVDINGDFALIVMPGTPIRIIGDAEIPDSWDRLLDGWASPESGQGWVIELSEASSVTVTEG